MTPIDAIVQPTRRFFGRFIHGGSHGETRHRAAETFPLPTLRDLRFQPIESSMKLENQTGAGLTEYAILVALISVVALAALQKSGTNISDVICRSAGHVRDDPHELHFSFSQRCCGYSPDGFGTDFECV